MTLKSMRIVLTGASGGIGEACSLALTRAGASLLRVGRSAEKLAALNAKLGPRVECLPVDLSLAADRLRLAEYARSWQCNAIVHCAGEAAFGQFESIADDTIERVLETNLLAPAHLSRLLFDHLRTQDAARIVFIGSVLGRIGVPGYALYGASKAGVYALAEALRREWSDAGIAVQYLGPRATQTRFNSPAAQRYAAETGSRSDPPERVARALMAMLDDGVAVRHLGWPERIVVRLNGLLGPLLDRAFVGHAKTLRKADPQHVAERHA
jgi:short-subunit dehydrogenase